MGGVGKVCTALTPVRIQHAADLCDIRGADIAGRKAGNGICNGACGNQVIRTDGTVGARTDDEDIVAKGDGLLCHSGAVDHGADEHLFCGRGAVDGSGAVGCADDNGLVLHIFTGIFRRGIAKVETGQLDAAALTCQHAVTQAEP